MSILINTRIGPELAARIGAAWPAILAGVAGGDLVRNVLKAANVTYAHVRAFIQQDPARRAEWDDAREQSAEAFIDEAVDIARGAGYPALDEQGELIYDKKTGKPLIIRPDSAHARTLVDTLKWAARIRNPRAYSDKAQLDINVKTVDLTRIISEANARLARGRAPVTLEHDVPALLGHAADAAIAHSASRLLELL